MKEFLEIEVEERKGLGRPASRQIRRQGLIPGIVYGGKRPPVPISIDPKRLQELLVTETGRNTIFLLRLKGKDAKRHAMIKELQRDPVTSLPIHTDFIRILLDERVEVAVPVQIQGEAEGVRMQEGILDFIVRQVRVSCLPTKIPEKFIADVTALKIGDSIKVADLQQEEDVEILESPDQAVAVISAPLKEIVEEEAAAEEEAQEPEVISKGKPAEEKDKAQEEESKGKESKGQGTK